jgi:hypothetical protein
MGMMNFNPSEKGFLSPDTRIESAILGGMLMGIFTAPLGTIFGYIAGHKENYVFRKE